MRLVKVILVFWKLLVFMSIIVFFMFLLGLSFWYIFIKDWYENNWR